MTTELPTSGQLELELAQQVQALYLDYLDLELSNVVCQIFDNKLVIVLEDSLTPTEQVLIKEGQEQLAQQVRLGLDDTTKPQLESVIEEVLAVGVKDILSDATLETGRTGIIAVLDNIPKVRDPETISKATKTTSQSNTWIDLAITRIVLNLVDKTPSIDSSTFNNTSENASDNIGHNKNTDSQKVEIDSMDPEYQQMIENDPLTNRELEVLKLIVAGCDNATISEKLFITVGTVKTHVRSILNKLCADDRTQAAVSALRSGLVE